LGSGRLLAPEVFGPEAEPQQHHNLKPLEDESIHLTSFPNEAEKNEKNNGWDERKTKNEENKRNQSDQKNQTDQIIQ
jgi:hypothetical protein